MYIKGVCVCVCARILSEFLFYSSQRYGYWTWSIIVAYIAQGLSAELLLQFTR
jgi:hypothetical protein